VHLLGTQGVFRTESSFEMRLVLHERNVGPITLLELGERLTIENVPELRDRVQDLAIQGRRSLLLDCSQIRAIDSQGIGGLVSNWLSLKKQGGRLKLLNPSVRMREVLNIAGLQKLLECFDNIEVALRNF
jgi:anti-sigma B factor antagonist